MKFYIFQNFIEKIQLSISICVIKWINRTLFAKFKYFDFFNGPSNIDITAEWSLRLEMFVKDVENDNALLAPPSDVKDSFIHVLRRANQ